MIAGALMEWAIGNELSVSMGSMAVSDGFTIASNAVAICIALGYLGYRPPSEPSTYGPLRNV
jgi:hypothetical protein